MPRPETSIPLRRHALGGSRRWSDPECQSDCTYSNLIVVGQAARCCDPFPVHIRPVLAPEIFQRRFSLRDHNARVILLMNGANIIGLAPDATIPIEFPRRLTAGQLERVAVAASTACTLDARLCERASPPR